MRNSGQRIFTTSKVATDQYELMLLQSIKQTSIAHANKQLDSWRCAVMTDRKKSITEWKKSTYTQQVSNRQHTAVKLLSHWTDWELNVLRYTSNILPLPLHVLDKLSGPCILYTISVMFTFINRTSSAQISSLLNTTYCQSLTGKEHDSSDPR